MLIEQIEHSIATSKMSDESYSGVESYNDETKNFLFCVECNIQEAVRKGLTSVEFQFHYKNPFGEESTLTNILVNAQKYLTEKGYSCQFNEDTFFVQW